jgi:hypothetical protein
MNNDKRTTRENAMLWWNNLGNAEKIKFWNKYPYMIPSFSTRLPKDLTGVEIERLYTAEHPTETESKGQEPEVDLLAHDNYPFGSTAELGSRERSLYEHKKESFIAGYNSLAEQNKLLREALEFVTDRLGTWINMGEWNETDQSAYDKAKNLLNQ